MVASQYSKQPAANVVSRRRLSLLVAARRQRTREEPSMRVDNEQKE